MLKRLVTAKVLGATAGALALGGVAVAASTGSLPSSRANHAAPAALSQHAKPLPAHHSSPTASASVDPTATDSASAPASAFVTATATPSARPVPSLPGLCRAWLSGHHDHYAYRHRDGDRDSDGDRDGDASRADRNPAFSVLISAAGSKQAVSQFCVTLLAKTRPNHPTMHPTAWPSRTADPDRRRPDRHRMSSHQNAPTSLPSAVPSHPSGG